MADISKSLPVLFGLEFSNEPKLALEQVPGESFMTWCGINRRDEADFPGWTIIDTYITKHGGLSKECSADAYSNTELNCVTAKFYKEKYWDRAKLDQINEQHKADEIFTAMVLNGVSSGIKFAQRVVGVTDDGAIGPVSLAAINAFNGTIFDKMYDDEEIKHHQRLVAKNPKFEMYIKGWINRDRAV